MDTVDPANYPTLSKLTLIASILNLLCTMTLKISLSIFLLRMVHQANRIVQRLVILNLISLVPFTVAVIIVDLVQCVPLQGYWDKSIQAKCIDTQTVNILLKAASGKLAPALLFRSPLRLGVAKLIFLTVHHRRRCRH